MLGAIEWSNLSIAGAFILGAIAATAATLHLIRTVATMLDSERRRPSRRHEDDDPTDGR